MSKYFIIILSSVFISATAFGEALIIDHNCTRLSKIPVEYLDKARKMFKMTYGHTSHGSQIISGMEELRRKNPDLFNFNWSGSGDALSIWDRTPSGDLGNPDRRTWADRTRQLLKDSGKSRNIVMWSWCGQVGNANSDQVDLYLELMSELEKEFPNVKFIYMTGHLNGTGLRGNLHKRNNQIRAFCRKKGKILFDFADIESYDPDGKINFNKFYARDNCDYRKDGKNGNWAREWIEKNPAHGLAVPARAAHTQPLNAALKARAFWYMMARLAGWNPPGSSTTGKLRPVAKADELAESPDEAKMRENLEVWNKSKKISVTCKFKKISDFRLWKELGTDESVISPDGTSLLVPDGGRPAMAVFRKKVNISELEFKAFVLKGSHLVWYINSNANGKGLPKKGIVGIMTRNGCQIIIDGKKTVLRGSPSLQDNWLYHFRIVMKNGMIYWGINRKLIAEMQIPDNTFIAKGITGIGGYMTKVKIAAAFLQGTE
jgi:hypothetical protein